MKSIFNVKGISAKIAAGYAAIILIAIIISTIIFFTVQRLRTTDGEISASILPMYIGLKEFSSLNDIAFKLSSNWIYQPNTKDKEDLKKLIAAQWPELRTRIKEASKKNGDGIITKFQVIEDGAKQIMTKLNVDSLYSNDVVIDECINILEKKIKIASSELNAELATALKAQSDTLMQSTKSKNDSYLILTYLVVFSIITYAIIGITASRISTKIIVQPINSLKSIVLSLGKGEIIDPTIKASNDEIGEMVESIKVMISGLRSNSNFAVEIGKGNYESEFTPLSASDQMGNALINMRSNLKINALEAERRNWSTAGLAKIGDILRKTDKGTESLYDNIILFIVKYVNANQGALFIINDEVDSDEYLELKACYAYDRKKYLNMRINYGEGLVGQCFLEKESIYITQVPKEFVKITSGLGDATPTCVLIVPIKINEEIHGVLELAFFKKLENFEIEFVEKIAESVASTVTSVKVSERTKIMVQELQTQSEEMKSQEEEMRQNMEELSATQEEMSRKEKEYLSKIAKLEALTKG